MTAGLKGLIYFLDELTYRLSLYSLLLYLPYGHLVDSFGLQTTFPCEMSDCQFSLNYLSIYMNQSCSLDGGKGCTQTPASHPIDITSTSCLGTPMHIISASKLTLQTVVVQPGRDTCMSHDCIQPNKSTLRHNTLILTDQIRMHQTQWL